MATGEKGGFSRFKNLAPEQLTYVQNVLSKGGEVMALARHIQQSWKLFTDVGEKTLFQQLNRYKTYLAQDSGPGNFQVVNAHGAALVKMKRTDKLDTVERMQALFHIQEVRLQQFLNKEAQLGMPMSGIDKVIMDMQTMLTQIQKLRFDLGMDAYCGVVPGGQLVRQGTQTVSSPDGTVTTTHLMEAVSTADAILGRALIPKDMGNVEVVSGS